MIKSRKVALVPCSVLTLKPSKYYILGRNFSTYCLPVDKPKTDVLDKKVLVTADRRRTIQWSYLIIVHRLNGRKYKQGIHGSMCWPDSDIIGVSPVEIHIYILTGT